MNSITLFLTLSSVVSPFTIGRPVVTVHPTTNGTPQRAAAQIEITTTIGPTGQHVAPRIDAASRPSTTAQRQLRFLITSTAATALAVDHAVSSDNLPSDQHQGTTLPQPKCAATSKTLTYRIAATPQASQTRLPEDEDARSFGTCESNAGAEAKVKGQLSAEELRWLRQSLEWILGMSSDDFEPESGKFSSPDAAPIVTTAPNIESQDYVIGKRLRTLPAAPTDPAAAVPANQHSDWKRSPVTQALLGWIPGVLQDCPAGWERKGTSTRQRYTPWTRWRMPVVLQVHAPTTRDLAAQTCAYR